jgi:hypothetical protein
LEKEHLSSDRGFVGGTCREGSYTRNSVKYVMDSSGMGVIFIVLHKGNLRHLARESSDNMSIVVGYCL